MPPDRREEMQAYASPSVTEAGVLTNRTVIVTGASRGIGAATARALARAGASVVLAARDEAAIKSIAAEIVAAGGRATAVATHVTDEVQVPQAIRTAVEHFRALPPPFHTPPARPPPP